MAHDSARLEQLARLDEESSKQRDSALATAEGKQRDKAHAERLYWPLLEIEIEGVPKFHKDKGLAPRVVLGAHKKIPEGDRQTEAWVKAFVMRCWHYKGLVQDEMKRDPSADETQIAKRVQKNEFKIPRIHRLSDLERIKVYVERLS